MRNMKVLWLSFESEVNIQCRKSLFPAVQWFLLQRATKKETYRNVLLVSVTPDLKPRPLTFAAHTRQLVVMMVVAGVVGFPVELLHGRENEKGGNAESKPREHSAYVCSLVDLGVVAPRLEARPRISLSSTGRLL